MANKEQVFETTFAGRPLKVTVGKTCELSNGSCWVQYGDTVVMGNVTASAKPREGIDFFPLSVDYEEKLYSVGKIPGSFLKRESRPSETPSSPAGWWTGPCVPCFPRICATM